MIKVAIDIGGVISKYPAVSREAIHALKAWGSRVLIITDLADRAAVLALLRDNNVCPPIAEEDVHLADYERYGEACKAVLARDLGVDVLLDDHGGYLAWPWPTPAPLRLQVVPDPRRPYNHPTWQIAGDFGRRVFDEELMGYADAIDRINRHLGGSGIDYPASDERRDGRSPAAEDGVRDDLDALVRSLIWQDLTPGRRWWHRDSVLTSFPTFEAARAHLLEMARRRASAAKDPDGKEKTDVVE